VVERGAASKGGCSQDWLPHVGVILKSENVWRARPARDIYSKAAAWAGALNKWRQSTPARAEAESEDSQWNFYSRRNGV